MLHISSAVVHNNIRENFLLLIVDDILGYRISCRANYLCYQSNIRARYLLVLSIYGTDKKNNQLKWNSFSLEVAWDITRMTSILSCGNYFVPIGCCETWFSIFWCCMIEKSMETLLSLCRMTSKSLIKNLSMPLIWWL